LDPPRFAPIAAFADLQTPQLSTLGELAEWLDHSPEQVEWMADERRTHRRATRPALQHYRYTFIAKSGGKTRLIEAPKARLKAIQRKILRGILSGVPIHACAHGFAPGRSCLSGAQIHASEAVVATFDLAQFFPSIGVARVHGLFRNLGYPWAVSRQLAGLCTTVTPASVFQALPRTERLVWDIQALYRIPHLPQGAPTSPTLANLLSWGLDRRLHGLAQAAEANYTRYADDLAFSGGNDFAAGIERFRETVKKIAKEEGFSLNAKKTRVMPRNTRQRVTGVLVNEHCNTGRSEFETLKAILYNCGRTGSTAQNRSEVTNFRSHLEGRVNWVEHVNPYRGAKLRRLFDRIDWSFDHRR